MKRLLLKLIRFYQTSISPFFPIEKYGAAKGGWLAFKRLMRCNPFNHQCPYDPVP